MDINRLLSDELSYEIRIRGISPDGTVAEKRKVLRDAIHQERDGQITICTKNIVPSEEVCICGTKLDDLLGNIQEFDNNNAENEYKRVKARLIHVSDRLKRIPSVDSLLNRRTTHLSELCEHLFVALEDAYHVANLNDTQNRSILDEPNLLLPERRVETTSNNNVPIASLVDIPEVENTETQNRLHSSALHHSSPRPHVSFKNDAPPRREEERFSCHNSTFAHDVKSVVRQMSLYDQPTSRPYTNFYRWNISFDGTTSVTSFLEDLEEMKTARCVCDAEILRSIRVSKRRCSSMVPA